jgi:AcrR family transcriptional regulator
MTVESLGRNRPMPKATFFNLPEKKREMILQAAVDEFALHPFEQASINRIVERAGIAKGSFYQYFENKKDLFIYLLDEITREKLAFLSPVMSQTPRPDFFQLLRRLYLEGIRFAVKYPRYAEISRKLLASKDSPIYLEVVQKSRQTSISFFKSLLQEAIQKGEVRDDIDEDMLAYLVGELNTLIIEYYLENISPKYDEEMIDVLDKFIDFLRFGIARRESQQTTPGEDK